jgi:hypothetical protein
MLTADNVLKKVEAEIGDNWDLSNAHAVDLRTSLVKPPVLLEYKNSWYQADKQDHINRMLSSPTLRLWLVLEEHPDTHKGYAIVYDEVANMYGLADAPESGDIFIAHYGTFLETFEAM